MTTITAREARTETEDLLDLVPQDAPGEGMPSPRQQELIEKLLNELATLDYELTMKAQDYTAKMNAARAWTPGSEGNTSRWINHLIRKIQELKTADHQQLEDGMYQLEGEIFKIQHAVHGSGHQYAKRLVQNDNQVEGRNNWHFVYAPGVVRQLRPSHRMTIEQARQFGALYGTCCVCGATLTNEKSIAKGIGPVCETNI